MTAPAPARLAVLQHAVGEGPALLGDYLASAPRPPQWSVVARWPGAVQPLPAVADLDGLVVLGGPQAAYDEDATLAEEIDLLRAAVTEQLPTLGICLGAQLLAVAGGGRVARGDAGPEFGASLVRKADAAAADPVFGRVPFLCDVVQWHGDAITALPPTAQPLFAGARYPHQGFRLGSAAWGVQFHLEADVAAVRAFAAQDGVDPTALLADVAAQDLPAVWRGSVHAFAELVADRAARRAGGGPADPAVRREDDHPPSAHPGP